MNYTRVRSIAATAVVMMLAGCGSGTNPGSGTSPAPGKSPTSAAPALDIERIQTAAARQIEADQRGRVLPGQTTVSFCADVPNPAAGRKFLCSVSAIANNDVTMEDHFINSFNGTANITLNDAAGKSFSLEYTMSNMPLPSQGAQTTLSGTDPSVS